MSKIIAAGAIRGAHQIFGEAKEAFRKAMDKFGPNQEIPVPNTAYYLPIIYGITGIPVAKVGEMEQVLKKIERILPPVPTDKLWVPYLGHTLDAGMATLWAEEIIEFLKYLEDPCPYSLEENVEQGHPFWLGAANDKIMRERGVEFVDGSAPGFAAVVGATEKNEDAVKIATDMQQKNLYIFMCAGDENQNGKKFSEQLRDEGVQLGWATRLVPFGPDVTAAIYAIGFATRAALSFGGAKPGDYAKVLRYNKNRIFAFVMALGKVTDRWYATAAGAINYGFPTISNTDIPQILPTGVCTYEHVVSNVPLDAIVEKAIEVRGLKIMVTKIDIPVPFGAAFEGERIGKEDMYLELGNKKLGFEYVTSKEMNEVEDGKIELFGPDITDVPAGTAMDIGIWVEVAGRKMQPDFEPILERQIHHMINGAQGVFHMGQRDINWMRISKATKEKGFTLKHLGTIIHAKFHADYSAILDKVQIKIYTEKEKVAELLAKARATYKVRDARIAGLTDESVDIFYSCTLCQSFAPTHVCVITPERTGLCGAYNWFDGKAAFEIKPTGPNQPIPKGKCLDPVKGQWDSVNEFVYQKSQKNIERFNAYSIMEDPMTSCGCFECIAAILPMCNGLMSVNRDYFGETPCGMKFSTLAGTCGGGQQTPGFVGHSKQYIVSRKFVSAEGGILRLIWLPKALKEELAEDINKRGVEAGVENMVDFIADETVGVTEDAILEWLTEKGHPALTMDSLIG